MKLFLALLNFAAFGILWPYYIGGRTRGVVMVSCLAAPWFAFWFGWFSK